MNTGIRAADTPYVILLNNDTEADEYYVAEMVRAIERSPKIFSVSSRMIQMYHPELMDDAGDMYCILGWAYQRGVGQSVRKYSHSRRVFSACAGAAIYRREVFEKIGYFDEMHFAYLEDLDVATGPESSDTTMYTARRPLCAMWEAEPAVPNNNSFKVKAGGQEQRILKL